MAERYADGAATADELGAAFEEAFDVGADLAEQKIARPNELQAAGLDAVRHAAWAASATVHPDEAADSVASEASEAAGGRDEPAAQATLLRCLFGNPFRPRPLLNPVWLAWNGSTVAKLSQGIYDERAFDRLPILADALEEAGSTNADILSHCRSAGPHVRGCWVIDLLLGKQ
jgi:hypothetical protein